MPLFVERIGFPSPDEPGDWGATLSRQSNGPGSFWTEVDFHARRALHSVSGSAAGSPTLQVDLGGTWVCVHPDGTLRATDTCYPVNFLGGRAALPGIVANRFRLNHASEVTVSAVEVRSVPANVSLSLKGQAPFWTHLGEMTQGQEAPDVAAIVNAFLATAQVENGFYVLPIVLHSDSIARLDVWLDMDFVRSDDVLPAHLTEIRLPYDFGGLPAVQEGLLQVRLPAGARIVPEGTSARVNGAFQASRVVFGMTGEAGASAFIPVTAGRAQAQPFIVSIETPATAIDLLLAAVTRTAKVEANIFPDSDGKPFDNPLLQRPVSVSLNRDTAGTLTWISAPLHHEFLFRPATAEPPGSPIRYWLVVHAIEGEVVWGAAPASHQAVGLQSSESSGLAWRQTTDPNVPGPLEAKLRLRHTPAEFHMPVAFQVGTADAAHRVSLDRFQPLGRVDFALDGVDMAGALNGFVDSFDIPECPSAEHLDNGGFDTWLTVNLDEQSIMEVPEFWTLTSGSIARWDMRDDSAVSQALLGGVRDDAGATGLSQLTAIVPGCRYEFRFQGLAAQEGALAEIIWRGSRPEEAFLATETVPIQHLDNQEEPEKPLLGGTTPRAALLARLATLASSRSLESFPPIHRAFVTAPAEATQAEIRFIVPETNTALIDSVSFIGTANVLSTPVLFGERPNGVAAPSGWEVNLPEDVPGVLAQDHSGTLVLRNASSDELILTQAVAVVAEQLFSLDVTVRASKTPAGADPASLMVRWRNAAGTEQGTAIKLFLDREGDDPLQAEGRVPAGAEEAVLHLLVPPGQTLVIERIAFEPRQDIPVPFTFVAQSPGEITLSDVRLAYELTPGTRPAVPLGGLHPPTPPGRRPDQVVDGCCYCACCAKESTLSNTRPVVTAEDRSFRVGTCPDCGTVLVQAGGVAERAGRPVSLNTAVALARVAAERAFLSSPAPAETLALTRTPPPIALVPPPNTAVSQTEGPTEDPSVPPTPEARVEPASLAVARELAGLLADEALVGLQNFKLQTLDSYSAGRILGIVSKQKPGGSSR